MKIRPLQTDLSAFGRLELQRPPVGIKYLFFKPEEIEQLSFEKNLSLCEMLKEAQFSRKPFYFGRDNNETCVGKILLGMTDMELFAEAGEIGPRLNMMQEARVNHNFYHHVPRLAKGIVNYVAFAPMDQLAFEPDVLIVAAQPKQGEAIMRAMTYSTGEPYASKSTMVMGCSWVFVYPFETGNVNFVLPEWIHGMTGRELFEPNSALISIPYRWLPTIAKNLGEIKLPFHTTKQEYLDEFAEVIGGLAEASKNP
jgi:uncharacterized protein (DUF169 family)